MRRTELGRRPFLNHVIRIPETAARIFQDDEGDHPCPKANAG